MQKKDCVILENTNLAQNTYRMRLSGNFPDLKPGQFISLQIRNCYLRRPISVCTVTDNDLTILYKTVGRGTNILSRTLPGEIINVLAGLGSGYHLENAGEHPLLIGGGIGCPPLYFLAQKLRELGKDVTVILGFNHADEVILYDDFKDLGCHVLLTTADGTAGIRGFVTDALAQAGRPSYIYACGPMIMLKNVAKMTGRGEYSLEERMGCGFGVCLGCTIETASGPKRVCKDGPVFTKEELGWED